MRCVIAYSFISDYQLRTDEYSQSEFRLCLETRLRIRIPTVYQEMPIHFSHAARERFYKNSIFEYYTKLVYIKGLPREIVKSRFKPLTQMISRFLMN